MKVDRRLIELLMACGKSRLNSTFQSTLFRTDIPWEDLQVLKKRGAHFNAVNDRGISVLMNAIICNRSIDCVKNLIKLGADPKAVSHDGYTSLHLAVQRGNLEVATFLVSEGVDVNAVDKNGDTAFDRVFALKAGAARFAKLLLENGVDIQTKNKDGYTPAKLMMNNFTCETFNLIQVLKEYKADFNCADQDPKGCSLLYSAVSSKRPMGPIEALVVWGAADPNLANNKGQTPLFMAVVRGYMKAAEFLISVGCDVNVVDNKGDTALHFVLQTTESAAPIARLLLAKGANVNAKNAQGLTPVGVVGLPDQGPSDLFEVLEILKEHGADFNSVDFTGNSPLSYCLYKGRSTTLMQKLVDLGADLDHLGEKGDNMTLLQLASNNFDLDAVKWLLSLGADINKIDNICRNALFYVFINRVYSKKSYKMLKFLLKRGINVNSPSIHGATLLHWLSATELPKKVKTDAEINTEQVFELLKTHGANFNALDHKGRSPLELAIQFGKKSIEFITSLLDHGADPKITFTSNGTRQFTSLHLAGVLLNLELVKLLISRGCDVNAKDNYFKETPLHSVIGAPKRNGNMFEITKLLLDSGADPNIQNGKGRTVLDYAMNLEGCYVEQKTIDLLISKGTRNSEVESSMATCMDGLSVCTKSKS